MIFTELKAKRILDVVDKGLTKGKGKPIPGELCVEAAVCLALGLPHGDNPDCVGEAVRGFKIILNDCNWKSKASRATGMRKLAVAQVGSDTIDQQNFAEIVALETVKQLIPRLFDVLEIKGAEGCRDVKTLEEAQKATSTANTSTANTTAAVAIDASYASYAAKAAYYAANCAAKAAKAAAANHAANAADYHAANAADYAQRATGSDEFLLLSAQIGLDALIQLNSPGCQFLYLCE